jgi:hypothetical protein
VEIRLCGGRGDAFGCGRCAEWRPDKTLLTFSVRHVLAHPSITGLSIHNFLNPLNTDFNPSTTGLLYARAIDGPRKEPGRQQVPNIFPGRKRASLRLPMWPAASRKQNGTSTWLGSRSGAAESAITRISFFETQISRLSPNFLKVVHMQTTGFSIDGLDRCRLCKEQTARLDLIKAVLD